MKEHVKKYLENPQELTMRMNGNELSEGLEERIKSAPRLVCQHTLHENTDKIRGWLVEDPWAASGLEEWTNSGQPQSDEYNIS